MENFEELECIGKGSIGSVVLALNKQTSERCAIKKMRASAIRRNTEGLVRDILALQGHKHRYLVALIEPSCFAEDDLVHTVMEYMAHGTLADRIDSQARDKELFLDTQIVAWLTQLALALEYIHSRGLVHRAVKAHNVFLAADGHVRLGEFGHGMPVESGDWSKIERLAPPPELLTHQPSPEQLTAKSDMWGLGVILYELTCLCFPFVDDNVLGVMHRITSGSYAPLPSHVVPYLKQVVVSLLSVSTHQRMSSTEVVNSRVVADFLADGPEEARDVLVSPLGKQAPAAELGAARAPRQSREDFLLSLIQPSSADFASMETAELHAEIKGLGFGASEAVVERLSAWQPAKLYFSRSALVIYLIEDGRKRAIFSRPVVDFEYRRFSHSKRKYVLVVHCDHGELLLSFATQEAFASVVAFALLIEDITRQQEVFERFRHLPAKPMKLLATHLNIDELSNFCEMLEEVTYDAKKIFRDQAKEVQEVAAEDLVAVNAKLRVWTHALEMAVHNMNRLTPGEGRSEYMLELFRSVVRMLRSPGTRRADLMAKVEACQALLLPSKVLLETCDSLTPEQFLREIDQWQEMVDTVTRIFELPVVTEKDGKIVASGRGLWQQAQWETVWLDVTSAYLRIFRDRDCVCEMDLRRCTVRVGPECQHLASWEDGVPEETMIVVEGKCGQRDQSIFLYPLNDWSSPDPVAEARGWLEVMMAKEIARPRVRVLVTAYDCGTYDEYLIHAEPEDDILNPVVFRDRYSALLELHKQSLCIFGVAVVGGYDFPAKRMMFNRNPENVLRRASNLCQYFEEILSDFRLRNFWSEASDAGLLRALDENHLCQVGDQRLNPFHDSDAVASSEHSDEGLSPVGDQPEPTWNVSTVRLRTGSMGSNASQASLISVSSTALLRARLRRSGSANSLTPSRRGSIVVSTSSNSVFAELRDEKIRKLQAHNEKLLEDEHHSPDYAAQLNDLRLHFQGILEDIAVQDSSLLDSPTRVSGGDATGLSEDEDGLGQGGDPDITPDRRRPRTASL